MPVWAALIAPCCGRLIWEMISERGEIQPIRLTPKSWDALNELALDLRWSWNHASDKLWAKLNPELWELTRNPWLVLQSVSRARLAMLLADTEYQRAVDHMLRTKLELETRPLWFQQFHPEASVSSIAYFSMEFMLSEALPIYSGGLGNVAGDQLKSASDLGSSRCGNWTPVPTRILSSGNRFCPARSENHLSL